MTLAEMANFICGKVNQTDAEDVTACKGFLTRRHELIWNAELWKDSLVEFRQTLDPDVADYTPASNYLPSKGVLLLPPIIQRVLGARTAERTMNAQRPEYYYRIDYDAFSKTGTPAEYILLPPCVWEWNTAQTIFAKRASAGDGESALSVDLLDSDGTGVTRSSVTLDEDYKEVGTSDRIDAISGAARSGSVVIGAPGLCTVLNQVTIGLTTFDVYFTPISPPGGSLSGFTVGATLATGEDAVLSPDLYFSYTFPNDPGALLSQEMEGATDFGGTIAITNGGLVITRADPSGVTMAATETNAKRRQRIRLIEIPTTEQTIRVLGKRICPTFSADNDEAAINGSDNLIIALGTSDMLQRERQYGKARELQEEAKVLMGELKKLEVVQQVHHHRIIPECGFGDDYFTGGRRGFHF